MKTNIKIRVIVGLLLGISLIGGMLAEACYHLVSYTCATDVTATCSDECVDWSFSPHNGSGCPDYWYAGMTSCTAANVDIIETDVSWYKWYPDYGFGTCLCTGPSTTHQGPANIWCVRGVLGGIGCNL
jgi:hypothetical protein